MRSLPRVMELILPFTCRVLLLHLYAYTTCFSSVSLITRPWAPSWFSCRAARDQERAHKRDRERDAERDTEADHSVH